MSKIDFDELAMRNPYLNDKLGIIRKCVELIETILPDEATQNFVNNLKTLVVVIEKPNDQVFSDNSDDLINVSNRPYVKPSLACYVTDYNQITISGSFTNVFFNNSLIEKDSFDYYYSYIFDAVLHELIHCATTKVSLDSSKGFNSIGIDEGYTDYLTKKLFQNKHQEYILGYKELIFLAEQVELLVGQEKMMYAFSVSHSLDSIMEDLVNKGVKHETVHSIFSSLNIFHHYRFKSEFKDKKYSDSLAYAQHYLNEALKGILNKMSIKDAPGEELMDLINNFKNCFVDEKLIKKCGDKVHYFKYIDESTKEFYDMYDKVKEYCRSH